MRQALRFVLALVVGLALLTWGASVLVFRTTRTWFERDMQLRAELAVNGAREALAARWAAGLDGELLKVGSAYYAPSAGTIAMAEAILLDQRRLIPCSVLHQGEYGIRDVYSGTVCQLGEGGIQRTFELPLTDDERTRVVAAAQATKDLVNLITE